MIKVAFLLFIFVPSSPLLALEQRISGNIGSPDSQSDLTKIKVGVVNTKVIPPKMPYEVSDSSGGAGGIIFQAGGEYYSLEPRIDRLEKKVDSVFKGLFENNDRWSLALVGFIISLVAIFWNVFSLFYNNKRSIIDQYWLREVLLPEINDAVSAYVESVKKRLYNEREGFTEIFDLTEKYYDEMSVLRGIDPVTYKKIRRVSESFGDRVDLYAASSALNGKGEDGIIYNEGVEVVEDIALVTANFRSEIIGLLADFHLRFSGFKKGGLKVSMLSFLSRR